MEIHPSLWTILLAKVLGKDISEIYLFDHVVAATIVFGVCLLLGFLVKSNVKLIPGPLQQSMELLVGGLLSMLEDNIGPQGKNTCPLLAHWPFIFISNFLGMIPGFSAATGNFNTTIACALIVFIYYNYQGLKEHGVGYIKHFMGPVPFLAPLMFPIEVIGHLARPFSLGVRLFGNISGEHIVTLVFYGLVPYFVPIPMLALGLFAGILQTFVFIMLSQIYIAGAIAHDH